VAYDLCTVSDVCSEQLSTMFYYHDSLLLSVSAMMAS